MRLVVMPVQFRFRAKTFLTKKAFINPNNAREIFSGICCLVVSECLQDFHQISLREIPLLIGIHLWCTPRVRTGNADRLNETSSVKSVRRVLGGEIIEE